jgi:hypothetical protein
MMKKFRGRFWGWTGQFYRSEALFQTGNAFKRRLTWQRLPRIAAIDFVGKPTMEWPSKKLLFVSALCPFSHHARHPELNRNKAKKQLVTKIIEEPSIGITPAEP